MPKGFNWDPSQWKYDTDKGGFGAKKDTGMGAKVPKNAQSDADSAQPLLPFQPPKSDRDVEMDFMQGRPVGEVADKRELEAGDWQLKPEQEDEVESQMQSEYGQPPGQPGDTGPSAADHYKRQLDALHQQINEFPKNAAELDPQLAREIAAAQATYEQSKDELASKEMWESIIQGLGYLAAGVIGHQTGLNLGGIKFDKKNWEARRGQIMDELQSAKADAWRKMDTQQRQIAEQRAQRMDEFRINQAQLDYAYRKEQDAKQFDLQERKLKSDEIAKKRDAFVRALSNMNKGQADIKDLNRYFENVDRALNNYKEKNNSKNFMEVRRSMEEANKRAADAGLPTPYDIETITKESKGFFGSSRPDYEEVTQRYIEQLQGGGQFPRDPDIENYAKQNNLSYEQALAIINKRRGNQ